MDEPTDLQGTTIGAGSVLALVSFAVGRYTGGAFGLDAAALAVAAFGVTAAALSILHASFGRRDFAASYAVVAIGLFLVAPAASARSTLVGYAGLLAGGAYVAIVTVRARREE